MKTTTAVPAPAWLCCGQCGRPLPDDESEVGRWRHGYLAGELDEVSAPMLLCPDCAVEAHLGRYDAGVAD